MFVPSFVAGLAFFAKSSRGSVHPGKRVSRALPAAPAMEAVKRGQHGIQKRLSPLLTLICCAVSLIRKGMRPEN